MSDTRSRVLFVSDLVVLPGMAVSLELDESSHAAVDAARASSDGRILVAPRLEDRYSSYGVIAGVERVGRCSSGCPAAVLEAEQRGSEVTGPVALSGSRWSRSPSTPASSPRSTSDSWSRCSSAARPGSSSTRSTR